MSNVQNLVESIASQFPRKIELGLSRIRAQAQSLGLLHDWSCPIITVAGTNGKGSCVRLLEAAYCRAGYKVFSFTSPHISRFNERFRLNGQMVTDQQLKRAISHCTPQVAETGTTFFEFSTLLGLQLARWQQPDVMILEVGLGGRLDATNVVDATIAVITSIGIDHQEYLGDTRDKIAAEKAGVFKPGAVAICGDEQPPAVIEQVACAQAVTLHQANRDFSIERNGETLYFHGLRDAYCLKQFQLKPQNIATAIATIEALSTRLPVSHRVITQAMMATRLEGRFEQTDNGRFVLDVAHNADSVAYLHQQCLSQGWREITVIIGVLRTKSLDEILKPMLPLVRCWHCVDLPDQRGFAATEIESRLHRFGVKSCYTWAHVDDAVEACMQQQQECTQPVVVFGSFVTVDLAKRCLHHSMEQDASRRVGVEHSN